MTSNTEKGRRFQLLCKVAMERLLGVQLELEVSVKLSGEKSHKFDLATHDCRVLVECKNFGWTQAGNVPSAKISTLREAARYLAEAQTAGEKYLVVRKSPHPKSGETLGHYFARLNPECLIGIRVFELSEEGGDLEKVFIRQAPTRAEVRTERVVAVGELGAYKRRIARILDWREGNRHPEESISKRVSRLKSEGLIPSIVANKMQTIVQYRNVAEHEEHELSHQESAIVELSWSGVKDWAEGLGWRE